MKKITTLLFVLSFTAMCYAQKFQATMKAVGNTLEFYVRPDANTTMSFTGIEFFVRYSNTLNLNFSNLVVNTTNFPSATFNYPNISERESGFKSAWFWFNTLAPPVTQTYTSGQEYKVFSVTVTGDMPMANLQLMHDPVDEDPYYLALTNDMGGDVRPVAANSFFYPSTLTSGDFRYFELSNVVLPLSLLDFTAQAVNKASFLSWKTSNERNASHFDIERSTYSKHWEKIGTQKAGYTEGYAFTDDKAFEKSLAPFYRLKMVDNDGDFTYSPIRQVKTDKASGLKVYPNPAKGLIQIEGIDANEEGQVVDAIGKVHTTFNGQQTLDLSAYTEGVYFIKMASGKVAQFVVSQ